jgi:hypothetical protein
MTYMTYKTYMTYWVLPAPLVGAAPSAFPRSGIAHGAVQGKLGG